MASLGRVSNRAIQEADAAQEVHALVTLTASMNKTVRRWNSVHTAPSHPGEIMQSGKPCSTSYLVFGASLRADSLNRRLATLAASVVEEAGGTVVHASMGDFDCPSYNGDVEASDGIPAGADRFRSKLVSTDGFIISCPEYNASMPGILKNVVDWVSRYKPQPLKGRHGLLMSASPSMAGGNRGLWAFRVPLEHLGARVFPDMFSLAQAHEAIGDDGRLRDAKLQKWFEGTVDCFIESVEAAKHYPALKSQWIEFLGERPNPATERVEVTEIQPV